MELDNLKDLWRDIGQTYVHQDNDEQILMMLQKRSRNPIAKMKRNLLFELIVVVIFYSLGIWNFIVNSDGLYWELAVLLLIVAILFLFYYYRKNSLLNEMQCVTCEVRSNLQRQLTTLEKYVKFYFISGTVLTPVVYFTAALVVIYKNSALYRTSTEASDYIIIIIVGLVITLGSYFLNRWYVKKLYGQHIIKLRELLQQMEEKESI